MSYKILTRDEYGEYESFVKNHCHGSFTQSLNWTKVKSNWQFEAVASYDDAGRMRGAMLVLILPDAKKDGRALLYAPRGPVCDYSDSSCVADMLAAAKELCRRFPAGIFKIDPYITSDDGKTIGVFTGAGFDFTPGAAYHDTIQPRENYMMCGIGGMSHDEMLMRLGRKTRYYVKMPFERGVTCEFGGLELLDDFYMLYGETAVRQRFTTRPKQYFRDFITAFGENIRIYLSHLGGTPLAGALTVNYAGKCDYVYGCSSALHRDLYPTYALQWRMIQWALDTNCYIYDMGGSCTDPAESEQLYSVYQFKKKFRGEKVEFAGEFVLNF